MTNKPQSFEGGWWAGLLHCFQLCNLQRGTLKNSQCWTVDVDFSHASCTWMAFPLTSSLQWMIGDLMEFVSSGEEWPCLLQLQSLPRWTFSGAEHHVQGSPRRAEKNTEAPLCRELLLQVYLKYLHDMCLFIHFWTPPLLKAFSNLKSQMEFLDQGESRNNARDSPMISEYLWRQTTLAYFAMCSNTTPRPVSEIWMVTGRY